MVKAFNKQIHKPMQINCFRSMTGEKKAKANT